MDTQHALALPVDAQERPRPVLLLKSVYRLYRERFWTWFAIIAPTSLVAAGIVHVVDYQIREIYRTIPHGEILYHKADIAETFVLRFAGFFLSWLLGCFALGAISSEVDADADKEHDDGTWKHDAHQLTREHFGKVTSIACFTFFTFLIGLALAQIVEISAVKALGWQRFRPFLFWAELAGYVIVASIISWLGTAVPLVIKADCKVWAALKKSIELSSGYEGAFLWLVLQSVLGAYAVWYLIHYLTGMILPFALLHTSWGHWGLVLIAVLASAAIDSPLFISFSLLAGPEKIKEPFSFPEAQQTPGIDYLR